jgi:hypothetical protein
MARVPILRKLAPSRLRLTSNYWLLTSLAEAQVRRTVPLVPAVAVKLISLLPSGNMQPFR